MKKLLILALVLSQFALAGVSAAVQLIDFDAQAVFPGSVGAAAEVYGVVVNGAAVAAPLPLDFANYEYTVVVTGLVMDTSGVTSNFSNGTVVIYQDAGTSAVWSDPSTFSDGVAVLSGTMASFQHTMFTASLGAGSGLVDWTGGTLLTSLSAADQLAWPLLTGVSRSPTQVEPGYSERWDGKLEPTEEVVATETQTWSELKIRFK
jgi:hypothetical protein